MMHRLTRRRQSVTVMTVNSLRTLLESISGPSCKFSVHKAHRDRVAVRCDYVISGQRKRSDVLLPAYPTGLPDDAPCNNLNVVLDPVEFVGVESCREREVFAPLFGEEALAYYEQMHPAAHLPFYRCC